MADPLLVRCGAPAPGAVPRRWRRDRAIDLEIGSGDDVHLAVHRLTDRMCATPPPECLDLLEVASFVFAADQSETRGGTARVDYGDDWRRHFRFVLPVRRPELWNRPDVRAALAGALEFLTDDAYEFEFPTAAPCGPPPRYLFDGAEGTAFDEVALFSGGLDSLCGAVERVLGARRRVLLVSHRSATRVTARQDALFALLRDRADPTARPEHVPVTVNKDASLNRDFNQRSRSFVFAAVAAVVARLAGLDRIAFYENGVTGLNLPVSPELVGARASRTTHPQALARFARLFGLVFGCPGFAVENPFQSNTKAELLERLRERGHADLAAHTCSCGTVWGVPEARPHCGLCSQCVDRRLSALAAGLGDAEDPPERYACDPLTGPRQGTDRTFAERYVGTAREVLQFETPRAFAVRFPEVNAALGHLPGTPDGAAEACHDLYRRHAAGVERGLDAAIERLGALALGAVPVDSLLGLVLGRGAPTPSEPNPNPEPGFVVDRGRFEVRYNGRRWPFGPTKEFHLIDRLHRARGTFLTVDALIEDVWDDRSVTKNAVQRAAGNARRLLVAKLGLPESVIAALPDNYALVVPPA